MPIGGAASTDLGLGDMLGQQVKDETDEERKKRMQQMQQRSLMGPAASMLYPNGFGGTGMGVGLGGALGGR